MTTRLSVRHHGAMLHAPLLDKMMMGQVLVRNLQHANSNESFRCPDVKLFEPKADGPSWLKCGSGFK